MSSGLMYLWVLEADRGLCLLCLPHEREAHDQHDDGYAHGEEPAENDVRSVTCRHQVLPQDRSRLGGPLDTHGTVIELQVLGHHQRPQHAEVWIGL